LWRISDNAAKPNTEALMALDFAALCPEELLAAESAALAMRALLAAVKTAPHGQGIATVEGVLEDKGFEHLRTLLTAALASHEGAQKKGPAVCPAPAASTRRSSGKRTRRSSAASGT
jgi:C4-type Zn-finger protein